MKFKYLILLLVFSGCHKTLAPNNFHEQELKQQETSSEVTTGVSAETSHQGTLTYADDIWPFENDLFNSNELLNPKIAHSVSLREKLSRVNRAILALHQKENDVLIQNKVLERYETSLMHGCGEDLKNCDAVEIFTQDPFSVQVALLIAETKKDVADYYKMLFVAFTLKNQEAQPKLLQLYLARSSELSLLAKQNPKFALLSQNQNLLSLVMSDPSTKQNAEYKRVLDSLSTWDYSLESKSADALSFFLANLKTNLYDSGGKLSESFSSALNRMQSLPNSFMLRQEQFFKTKTQVAANLQLKKLSTRDEYFYLIDRLYNNQIELGQAQAIWDSSHKDYRVFSSTLKNYIQVEFIEKILWSHEMMSQVLSEKNKVVISDIFSQALLQSQPLAVKLGEFSKSVNTLGLIESYILAQKGMIRDDTLDYLNATDKNIYYYAVLPHMMMLSRRLYKTGYNKTVRVAHIDVQVDGAQVTQFLYHEVYKPWFDYSGIEKSKAQQDMVSVVKSQELLSAFDIALNTQAFDYYGITASDYVADLFTQLFAGFSGDISDDLSNLRAHFESRANLPDFARNGDWADFLSVCRSVETGSGFKRRIGGTETRDRMSDHVEPSSFTKGAFLGDWTQKLQALDGFYFHNANRNAVLENERLLGTPATEMLQIYITVYKNYLTKIRQPVDGLDIKTLEKMYTDMSGLIRLHLENVLQVRNEYDHCFFSMFNKEIEEQDKILTRRIAFLKSVYADMTQLRSNPELRNQLNQKYQFVDLGTGSLGTLRFDENVFHSVTLDFVIDARNFYRTSKDPIENSVEIYLPDDIKSAREYKVPKIFDISYTPDESAFIANGLNAVLSSLSSTEPAYVRWMDASFLTIPMYFDQDLISLKRNSLVSEELKIEDVYNLPMQFARFYNMKNEDIEVLKAAKRIGRFKLTQMSGYFNLVDSRPLSYFDYVLYGTFQDYLNDLMPDPYPSIGAPRVSSESIIYKNLNLVAVNQEALSYYILKSADAIRFFDLDFPQTDQLLKSYYATEFNSQTKLGDDLKSYALALNAKDKADGKAQKISIEIGSEFEVPYLSDAMIRRYDAFKFTFGQKTQNFYTP